MTLTRVDLIQRIIDTIGLNKREASELTDAFFEEISAALEKGEDVKLSGFGGFQLRDKSSRPGRNPKTGETAVITARRVVVFHASNTFKKNIEARMPASDKSSRGLPRPVGMLDAVEREADEFA
ncbi:integration host factor subunit alpha [Aromatoleum petrolei]|uniref:Integration host factor subunit alpha n=2 Tax=Aromatoleum TaxID=551759 RepID=A0ABX1MPF5_9RHOO|nr:MULTISPECIES: integration host factor subunit alpha [Aromatoleum]NMF88196.1 integration host factor subunit alpha [Aromatoleum petrolei]QTQ38947.1 Integration host factor, alpha subunit [Aromatoleum petrolei]